MLYYAHIFCCFNEVFIGWRDWESAVQEQKQEIKKNFWWQLLVLLVINGAYLWHAELAEEQAELAKWLSRISYAGLCT